MAVLLVIAGFSLIPVHNDLLCTSVSENGSDDLRSLKDGSADLHFAAQKKHIGLYPGDEAVAKFAADLEGYSVSKGTIRLPYDKDLPAELITRIAQWCDQAYRK